MFQCASMDINIIILVCFLFSSSLGQILNRYSTNKTSDEICFYVRGKNFSNGNFGDKNMSLPLMEISLFVEYAHSSTSVKAGNATIMESDLASSEYHILSYEHANTEMLHDLKITIDGHEKQLEKPSIPIWYYVSRFKEVNLVMQEDISLECNVSDVKSANHSMLSISTKIGEDLTSVSIDNLIPAELNMNNSLSIMQVTRNKIKHQPSSIADSSEITTPQTMSHPIKTQLGERNNFNQEQNSTRAEELHHNLEEESVEQNGISTIVSTIMSSLEPTNITLKNFTIYDILLNRSSSRECDDSECDDDDESSTLFYALIIVVTGMAIIAAIISIIFYRKQKKLRPVPRQSSRIQSLIEERGSEIELERMLKKAELERILNMSKSSTL